MMYQDIKKWWNTPNGRDLKWEKKKKGPTAIGMITVVLIFLFYGALAGVVIWIAHFQHEAEAYDVCRALVPDDYVYLKAESEGRQEGICTYRGPEGDIHEFRYDYDYSNGGRYFLDEVRCCGV